LGKADYDFVIQAFCVVIVGLQSHSGRLRKLACMAIHPDCRRSQHFIMDRRIKSGDDAMRFIAISSHFTSHL
jgi:hypothetical protein